MRAFKSITQGYQPTPIVAKLMEEFRQMTNECISVGLEFEQKAGNGETLSMRRLSVLSYSQIKRYGGYSRYRLSAISKAAGILSSRRKSIRRGFPTKIPYARKPVLVSCYGFRIEDGRLIVHLEADTFETIQLNAHTLKILSDRTLKVRSFTLTEKSLSLCITKEVEEVPVEGMTGIDRNLRNVTVGNVERITYYDVSKVVEIADNTRGIVRSFKRNDVRVRKALAEKYGSRRRERTRQILHRVSKDIVKEARASKQAIAFEDISGIRRLYMKGNRQRRSFRGRMNSWPFAELKRQVEYKAGWEGVPAITLSKNETRGTTMDCYRCGERLQDGRERPRQLWCRRCERWEDRDLVAVMNISRRGWVRFAQSKGKGEAGEAVKGNGTRTLILRVDASKLSWRPLQTKT